MLISLPCQSHKSPLPLFNDLGAPLLATYTGLYFIEIKDFSGYYRKFQFNGTVGEQLIVPNKFKENGVTEFRLLNATNILLNEFVFENISEGV